MNRDAKRATSQSLEVPEDIAACASAGRARQEFANLLGGFRSHPQQNTHKRQSFAIKCGYLARGSARNGRLAQRPLRAPSKRKPRLRSAWANA